MSGFSVLLDEVMRVRGLTMAELARRLEVQLPFVQKIVNDQRPPPAGRLAAMADALGLTGRAKDRFIDAGMLRRLGRLEPEAITWLEQWGCRIPPMPTIADLGLIANNPSAPPPLGRPRRRRTDGGSTTAG